ncbi:MAG TPA: hypothetical protein PK297_13970 [Spirochaetota bacterium]|nr:hypothetical protein [Spirochaetota bacterium]
MLSATTAFSLDLGGSLGYNLLLDDMDGGGLPAIETRITFGDPADSIRFGGMISYLPIYDYSFDSGFGSYSVSSASLCFMGFGKMTIPSSPLYAIAGAGLHMYTGDGSGSDLGVMIGAGFETPIAENMTLDIGARFHLILAGSSVKMLTLLGGINYKL